MLFALPAYRRTRWVRATAALAAALLAVGCASAGGGRPAALEPADINAAKSTAHDAIDAGDYKAAVETLQPIVDRMEREDGHLVDDQVYTMLANAYWKLGAYDQALPNFENALRLNYGSAEAHLNLAEMLMETGKIGRALTEFELAVEFGAGDALARYNYGLALYQFGRPEAALAQWEMAHSLDRRNPQYAEALGIGYSGRDDAKSLEFFELARELGADSPQFHNNFGILLQRLGRFEEAEQEFREATGADPDSTDYRANLATVYMRLERYGSAVSIWRELLAGDPDRRLYRVYLAKSLYAQGQYAEVVATLADWLESGEADRRPADRGEKQPGLNEAWDTLAMSYRGLDEPAKALASIEQAVALSPDNLVHLNNYGVILAENGRIDEAKAQWEKVLQLDPDNDAARQNLSAFAR